MPCTLIRRLRRPARQLAGIVLFTSLFAACGSNAPTGATGDVGVFAPFDAAVTQDGAAATDAGIEDSAAAAPDVPCASACAEGASRCDEPGSGVQRCVDSDDDGCFEWEVASPCGAGTTCAAGACVPACKDQDCTIAGARRCNAKGNVETCGAQDGCLAWGGDAACASGQTCDQGQCVAACANACTSPGATKCEGNAVKTCADSDGNGCLDWGQSQGCAAPTPVCANGACATSCKSTCSAQGAKQCDGKGVSTCGDTNADGCLTWGTPVTCGAGELCVAGSCETQCKSTCTVSGAKQCQLDAVQLCADHNQDGCLTWGTALPCAKGEVCGGAGVCATTCQSQCTTAGATQCGAGGVQSCGDYNNDGCLEWGTPLACPDKLVCSAGACVKSCSDQCSKAGDKRCVPGGLPQVQTCGDDNQDGCLAWGTAVGCAGSEACSKGVCVKTCVDGCPTKGAKQCGKSGPQVCDDYNKDGCLAWGTESPCAAWQACQAGTCNAAPVPAKVVINELSYDSAGPDTETFVELRGPAGTALSGFSLAGINGADGKLYGQVALAGVIGKDGLFVVAHPKATGAVKAAADQLSATADLQNGPDSVQLRWGDKPVDAVGYGVFGAGLTFAGEGKPAADVAAGHSLGRDQLGTDTDNNAADFIDRAVPTPGAPNPKPCAPQTCADLGATCGTAADGCGAVLACGTCAPGKVCGANKQCGDKPCAAKTCAELGVACGAVSDGCDKTLACGDCGAGLQCKVGKCVCKPKTCAEAAVQCGAASDGCGATLSCGTCKAGEACSQGACVCKPKSCGDLGLSCGSASDGCGGSLDCGTCTTGVSCGGGTCPVGWTCDGTQSCTSGDASKLLFDYKTVTVSGTVTVNGKPVVLTDYCAQKKTSSTYMTVEFEETTWGYGFKYVRRCNKNGDLASPSHFTQALYPGTYKVSVYIYSGYAKVPVSGTQVILPQLTVSKDTNNLALDYRTVTVSGAVTVNGKPVVLTDYCAQKKTSSTYMTVEFEETTWGYGFKYVRRCNKNGDLASPSHFTQALYPGTYKVSVYIYSGYAKVPVSGTQVIVPKLAIPKDTNNLALDYRTVTVSGAVTVNGKPVVLTDYCAQKKTSSTYMTVEFEEATWGYGFKYVRRCNKNGDLASPSHFTQALYPGTYKVSVYIYSGYAKVPVSGTQVIVPKLAIPKDTNNLALDYKTVTVSGAVTVNGKPVVLTDYCAQKKTSSTYMTVEFKETTWGYGFKYVRRCNKNGDLASPSHFTQALYPGTYKVSVYIYSGYAKVPVSGTQVIVPKLVIPKDTNNLALDYRTVTVSGAVTVNGKPVVLTDYCAQKKTSSTYMTVEFEETTWGYGFKYVRRCNKNGDLASPSHFTQALYPGTYKVSVYIYSGYAKVPVSGTQVIVPKLDVPQDTNNLPLDYKTRVVSGTVTHNGGAWSLTAYCAAKKTSSTYMVVQFEELTWGYTFKHSRRCNTHTDAGGFANFTQALYPGTYKATVYLYGGYAQIPISGTQVVVPKIRFD